MLRYYTGSSLCQAGAQDHLFPSSLMCDIANRFSRTKTECVIMMKKQVCEMGYSVQCLEEVFTFWMVFIFKCFDFHFWAQWIWDLDSDLGSPEHYHCCIKPFLFGFVFMLGQICIPARQWLHQVYKLTVHQTWQLVWWSQRSVLVSLYQTFLAVVTVSHKVSMRKYSECNSCSFCIVGHFVGMNEILFFSLISWKCVSTAHIVFIMQLIRETLCIRAYDMQFSQWHH